MAANMSISVRELLDITARFTFPRVLRTNRKDAILMAGDKFEVTQHLESNSEIEHIKIEFTLVEKDGC